MAENRYSFTISFKSVFCSTVKDKFTAGDVNLVDAQSYLNAWVSAVASSSLSQDDREAELKAIKNLQNNIIRLKEVSEKWVMDNRKKLLLPASENKLAKKHLLETDGILINAERRSQRALTRLTPVKITPQPIMLSPEFNASIASLLSTLQTQNPHVDVPIPDIPEPEQVPISSSAQSTSSETFDGNLDSPEYSPLPPSTQDAPPPTTESTASPSPTPASPQTASERPEASRSTSGESTAAFQATGSHIRADGDLTLSIHPVNSSSLTMNLTVHCNNFTLNQR